MVRKPPSVSGAGLDGEILRSSLFSTARVKAAMSYSTARTRFFNYLQEAGLAHKGYTVHCLRHTFASELLNASMRLEVLQQLLGHQDIEMTRGMRG
jgi:site-specific recombinase XerD